VYPNPVSYMLQLQVQSAVPGNFTLRVHDASGRLVQSRQYNVTRGSQTLSLPVQHLASGWYVLSLQHADGSVREVKFIKE
jgi:N6-adenosine-specific RNA methylase IME4